MNNAAHALFQPFRLGNLELPTRVVMAPMTRSFSPGGVPNAGVVEYYRRRAAAGVGLIVTEGTTINHKAANGYPNVPRFYGEDETTKRSPRSTLVSPPSRMLIRIWPASSICASSASHRA